MVVLMGSFFTEKTIAVCLMRSEVTVVQIDAPFCLGKPRYNLTHFRHLSINPADLNSSHIEELLSDFSESIPIVLIHQPSVCHSTFKTSKSSEKLLKPLLDTTGGYWYNNDGSLQIDSGLTAIFMNEISNLNNCIAGTISLAAAISRLFDSEIESSQILIIADPPSYTIITLEQNKSIYSRSLRCRESELSESIQAAIKYTQTKQANWLARRILWTGTKIPSALSRQFANQIPLQDIRLLKTDLISQTDHTPGVILAAGAAIEWMETKKLNLMMHTGETAAYQGSCNTKTSLFLRLAVLILLFCISGVSGIYLNRNRSAIKQIHEISSVQKQNSVAKHQLPGIQTNPKSVYQIRLHRYLEFLSETAFQTEVTLDNIHLSTDIIQLHGQAKSVSPINNFSKKINNYFLEKNAKVSTPGTTRNAEGYLSFQIEVSWDTN